MSNYFIETFKKNNPGLPVPPNIGKKWSSQEEQLLLEKIKCGLSCFNISEEFGRTECGIKSRLKQIAYTLYTKGTDMQTIIDKTGLTETVIQEKINKENSIKPKIKSTKRKNVDLEINLSSNIQTQEQIQDDIAEIKRDIKQIFKLLQQLELA